MLQGTYFVQIEESFDASKPFKERYVDVHNPGRVLKLQLSDGKLPRHLFVLCCYGAHL